MKSNRWFMKAAGAGALALTLATPLAAQSRGDWQRNNDSNRRGDTRSSSPARSESARSERVTLQGKVSSMSHENGGYRVRLDRDSRAFFVPESYVRNRLSDFRIGVNISLGGVYRGSDVYVDAVNWPGNSGYGYNGGYGYNDGSGYGNGYIRGVVDRVDYRSGRVWLRDSASGRLIEADMRSVNRYSRIDTRDLRRGDRVELSGEWVRGGLFVVNQVDSIRTR